MTDRQQLREDRALRDAARALVHADIAHLKRDLKTRGLGDRLFGTMGDGAKDVLEKASEAADNNRGVLAALTGAMVLWFARNPLLDLIFGTAEDEEERDHRD